MNCRRPAVAIKAGISAMLITRETRKLKNKDVDMANGFRFFSVWYKTRQLGGDEFGKFEETTLGGSLVILRENWGH